MTRLSRKLVQNRLRQREAKEQGDMKSLFLLMAVGGFLMAGHSTLSTANSLKNVGAKMSGLGNKAKGAVSSVTQQDALKKAGDLLVRDDTQQILEWTMKSRQNERDRD